MPRRRGRLLPSLSFMLAVLTAVAISAIAGVKGGALTGAVILLVMIAGSLVVSTRS